MKKDEVSLNNGELPRLSHAYFELADALAGEQVPRNFAVASVSQDPETGELAVEPAEPETALNPIALLMQMRDIGTYRARNKKELSRGNVRLAAQLGGLALKQLYGISKDSHLSEEALHGIAVVMDRETTKMREALQGASIKHEPATRALKRAQNLLLTPEARAKKFRARTKAPKS